MNQQAETITYKGKSLEYRIAHANSYREAIHAKYFKMYGWEGGNTRANYWTLWHHSYEVVCDPYTNDLTDFLGNGPKTWRVKTNYDLPLAYDNQCFLHLFCRLILKGSPLKIHSFLSEQFSGDLVDRTYIKGLIAQMKIMKLFTDGSAVVFEGDGYYRQLKVGLVNARLADAAYAWHSAMMRRLVSHSQLRLSASGKCGLLRSRRSPLKHREDMRARYIEREGFSWQEQELFNGSTENIARLELVEDWINLKEQEEQSGTLRYILLPATSDFQGEGTSTTDAALQHTATAIVGPNEAVLNIDNTQLTKRQVALLCYYQGRTITRNNALEVATMHGVNTSRTSAQQLIEEWEEWVVKDNIDKSHSRRIAGRLISDIKAILAELQPNERVIAEKHVKSITNKRTSENS